jgi:hypothetical protein
MLLVASFLFPKTWPADGVVFGTAGVRQVEIGWYWFHIYLAESGFLNRGMIIEDTWEESHGHTWPIGVWYSGWALSFCPAALGIALATSAHPRFTSLPKVVPWIGPLAVALTAVWLLVIIQAARLTTLLLAEEHTSAAAYAFALSFIHLVGILLLQNAALRSATTRRQFLHYWLRFCAQLLLVYLVWLGILLVTQDRRPFVGYAMSLAGAVCLWRLAARLVRSRGRSASRRCGRRVRVSPKSDV